MKWNEICWIKYNENLSPKNQNIKKHNLAPAMTEKKITFKNIKTRWGIALITVLPLHEKGFMQPFFFTYPLTYTK